MDCAARRRAERLGGARRRAGVGEARHRREAAADHGVLVVARRHAHRLRAGPRRQRELGALRRRRRDRDADHLHRRREGHGARDRREPEGAGVDPDRPQQSRAAVPRRLPSRPRERQARARAEERSLGGLPRRLGPERPLRLSPDAGRGRGHRSHRRGRQGGAVRRVRHRRRVHHGTAGHHRRRQDALRARQPRPRHQRAVRARSRDRQADADRRQREGRRGGRDRPPDDGRNRGLRRQLPEEGMGAGRGFGEGRRRLPESRSQGRVERGLADPRQSQVDAAGRPRQRAGHVLPLRPGCEKALATLHRASRTRRPRAGADGYLRDREPRRPRAAGLPVAAARQRSQRRRQARAGAADGAVRPRRAVGARRLRLQQHPPVARQPRLRGAVGQLPRLDGLRQEVPQRGEPRVRRQDARRPDRRGELGREGGHRAEGQGRDHGRLLRRLRDAGRPHVHARRRLPAASTSSGRRTSSR